MIPSTRRHGLTLVELLLALAISGMVAAGVAGIPGELESTAGVS